jgi:hypothetical protein
MVLVIAAIAGFANVLLTPEIRQAVATLIEAHGLALEAAALAALVGVAFLLVWRARLRSARPAGRGLTLKDLIATEKDVRETVGPILGGLVVLVGLYFTWQQLADTERATQENLRVAVQGQITARFTQAVDQLGTRNDDKTAKIETRIGGIYALEGIARDSDRPHDRAVVMEVLTAYVRQNAPWTPAEPSAPGATTGGRLACGDPGPPGDPGGSVGAAPVPTSTPIAVPTPRADIVAAVSVLARNDWATASLTSTGAGAASAAAVDWSLERTDLRGLDVRGGDLEGFVFRCAHLEGANLAGARLRGASFNGAHLEGAYLFGAQLEDAHLDAAYLQDADLDHADLSRAHLEGAHLDGVSLVRTRLPGAALSTATGLTPPQLTQACGDGTTSLPIGLRPATPLPACE